MCRKKVYYNTYADGMKDVTEKTTACREGKICSHPEIHQYERTFRFNKLRDAGPESQKSLAERKPTPYFLGELPTPRRSKSPSPANRRGSGVYVAGSGLLDVPKPSRDDRHHDRHDRHSSHRHSSRHADREPPSPRPKRSSQPHFVVIDQPSRGASRDIPLGPVHLVDEYGRSRRSSRERHHDRDHDRHHRHRSPSSSSQGYVVDDERERRRHQKRRMSTSGYPEVVGGGTVPVMADVYSTEPRRHGSHGLRRSNTLGAGTSLGASPPRVRWEDEVTARRARQNAEIASRTMAPEVHQEPPKGILKDTSGGKGKGRESADVRELRRAVEGMGVHGRGSRGEELDLYNRDRLRARLGGGADDEGGRDRRRRSKVWVAGDQYQYF